MKNKQPGTSRDRANGSIMLGIGYLSSALEEDEGEQVSAQLLLRSPLVIVCPKNRRSPKRTVPKLKDFRHDKFLSLDPEYAFGHEGWLRGVCKQLGGFEPDIVALANCPKVLSAWLQRDAVFVLGRRLLSAKENKPGDRWAMSS